MKLLIILSIILSIGNYVSGQTSEDSQEAKRLLMDKIHKEKKSVKSTTLTVFEGELAEGWKLKPWNGMKADVENKVLEFRQNETAKKWCGVLIQNKSNNNTWGIYDSSLLEKMFLTIELKTNAVESFKVALSALKKDNKFVNTKYYPLSKGVRKKDKKWTTIEISLNRFRNITTLDTVRGVLFQYVGEPDPTSELEINTIKLEYRGKDKSKFNGKVTVKDFDLPEEYEMVEKFWPDRAENIRVSGPRFTRNSTPVFLTGVEGQVFMFPWQYKLMNYDIIHLTAQYFQWFARTKKVKTGIEYSFVPQTWIDLQYKELLSNGLAVYSQPIEGSFVKKNKTLKKFAPEAQVNSSHFMGLRFDNETGLKLKKNFWKSVMSTTRKYPTTVYELYNELRYCDYSPANLALFKMEMQKKYSTIENANKTWGTNFASFDVVYPPKKLSSYAFSAKHIEPNNPSMALWVDWGRFIEKYLADHAYNFKKFIRKYEKNPNSQILLQSTSDLDQDYTGLIGVYPPYKRKYENIFGMEMGMRQYAQSEGSENIEELKLMLKGPFAWEMLRDLNQNMPVLAVENITTRGVKEYKQSSCVVNLHGTWKFSPENDFVKLENGVEKATFDDSNWKEISVPGVWGNQGFPTSQNCWYRKKFVIPETSKGKPLYLVGSELADKANVYLNDKLVRTTSKWNEKFCLDIADKVQYGKPNTLSIQIKNKHVVNGQVQGGIRKLIALSADKVFEKEPMPAGEFRNYLWSMALHGVSGTIMSYAYASDGRSLGMYSPSKFSYEAIRAMPKIPLEINSVAPILFPEKRQIKEVMCVYPFETGRGRLVPEGRSWFRGDVTMDILSYFTAAYFEQFDIGVTCNERIMEGALNDVKALFLLNSPRVMNGIPEKLEQYVKNGGVLILDADSMTINDHTHKKIETPKWFGVKLGKKIFEADEISEIRHRDNIYGINVELDGAKALISNAAGKPIVTEHSYGKGKVYYFARNIKQPRLRSIVKEILTSNGIAPTVSLKGDGYLSAKKMSSGDKTLWYLYNWGGGNKDITAITELPEGNYTVRNVVTGSVIENGITSNHKLQLTLKSHEPLILLFEKKGSKQIQLQELSPKHKEFISWWRKSPESEHKLLFCGIEDEGVCKSRIITGVRMLEESGFQVETGEKYRGSNKIDIAGEAESFDLDQFAVIALTNPRIRNTQRWREALKKYVENGGSLYLSASQHEGPHNWWNSRNMRELFALFDLKSGKNVYDKERFHIDYRLPAFSIDSSNHPIFEGCNEFQSKGMTMLNLKDHEGIMTSNSTSTPADAPIMTAFEFGRGRVVVMGDSKWMLPDYLVKADNAQLMMNIFNWLSRRPITVKPKEEIHKLINPEFK